MGLFRTIWRWARWAGRSEGGYITAAIGIAGLAVSAGSQVYGILSAPSGKMSTAQKDQLRKVQERQEQQYSLQRLLQPFMLEQMGLEAELGPGGNITNIRKKPKTASEQRKEEIQGLAEEKVLKGLRGELDIDPATERALREDAAIREEQIARTQGPSSQESTVAQTAREKGRESDRIIREQVRRGLMNDAEAMARAREEQAQRQTQYRSSLMEGAPGKMAALNLNYQDFAGYENQADYLRQMIEANRYAALGNLIGTSVPRIVRGFTGAGGGTGTAVSRGQMPRAGDIYSS